MTTRFLPFLVFSSKGPTPKYITYLGKLHPGAIFGIPIIYCLKDVSALQSSHGIPELIATAVTFLVEKRWMNMLVSIASGTVCHMLLVQFVFV